MKEPRIWESAVKPVAIDKLDNDSYYYNYKITEKTIEVEDSQSGETHQETRWTFIQAYIKGEPYYEDAIIAILRQHISVDEEFALINKFNAHKLGVITNDSVYKEYENYCRLVSEIKEQVKADFKV